VAWPWRNFRKQKQILKITNVKRTYCAQKPKKLRQEKNQQNLFLEENSKLPLELFAGIVIIYLPDYGSCLIYILGSAVFDTML